MEVNVHVDSLARLVPRTCFQGVSSRRRSLRIASRAAQLQQPMDVCHLGPCRQLAASCSNEQAQSSELLTTTDLDGRRGEPERHSRRTSFSMTSKCLVCPLILRVSRATEVFLYGIDGCSIGLMSINLGSSRFKGFSGVTAVAKECRGRFPMEMKCRSARAASREAFLSSSKITRLLP